MLRHRVAVPRCREVPHSLSKHLRFANGQNSPTHEPLHEPDVLPCPRASDAGCPADRGRHRSVALRVEVKPIGVVPYPDFEVHEAVPAAAILAVVDEDASQVMDLLEVDANEVVVSGLGGAPRMSAGPKL